MLQEQIICRSMVSEKFKKSILTILFIGASLTLFPTTATAETNNCFQYIKLEPSFIAFTTKKNSKLGEWYQRTFDLKIAKEFAFPDGSVTGILMHNDEFVVEVFYRNEVFEKQDYVAKSSSEQWRGFMKFGIYTDANLIDLKECLKQQGVKAGRIFNDKNLGIDLLQVIDPEQNVLEIISRIKK
ncbi:MAG: hypothetical protein ACI9IA_001023 [Enterobacterales bacterium]|jgi:hypothetical protein